MFIEKKNDRIRITNAIRTFLVEERKSRGFTAATIAGEMMRPQSWIAQIESGRTQTIRGEDLLKIFATILKTTENEADKYLEKNKDRFLLESQPHMASGEKESELKIDDSNLEVIKQIEAPEASEEMKESYAKRVNTLQNAFMFFYEKVKNKKEALDILGAILVNLQCDMGFTLSVAALPLCRMQRVNDAVKKKVFHEFAEQIMVNGTTCSADDSIAKKKETEKK